MGLMGGNPHGSVIARHTPLPLVVDVASVALSASVHSALRNRAGLDSDLRRLCESFGADAEELKTFVSKAVYHTHPKPLVNFEEHTRITSVAQTVLMLFRH